MLHDKFMALDDTDLFASPGCPGINRSGMPKSAILAMAEPGHLRVAVDFESNFAAQAAALVDY